MREGQIFFLGGGLLKPPLKNINNNKNIKLKAPSFISPSPALYRVNITFTSSDINIWFTSALTTIYAVVSCHACKLSDIKDDFHRDIHSKLESFVHYTIVM